MHEETYTEEIFGRLETLNLSIETKGKLLETLDEVVLTKAKIEDIENEVNESSLIVKRFWR